MLFNVLPGKVTEVLANKSKVSTRGEGGAYRVLEREYTSGINNAPLKLYPYNTYLSTAGVRLGAYI